jgi:hypothetical protein
VAVLPATLAHTVVNLLVPDEGTGDQAAVADVAGLRADLIAQLPRLVRDGDRRTR